MIGLNTVLFDFCLTRNQGFQFIGEPPKSEKRFGLNAKRFLEGLKKMKKNESLTLILSETQISMVIHSSF
jgi:hypothetical protein